MHSERAMHVQEEDAAFAAELHTTEEQRLPNGELQHTEKAEAEAEAIDKQGEETSHQTYETPVKENGPAAVLLEAKPAQEPPGKR